MRRSSSVRPRPSSAAAQKNFERRLRSRGEVGGSRKQRNNDVSLGVLLALISFLLEDGRSDERGGKESMVVMAVVAAVVSLALPPVRPRPRSSSLFPLLFTAFGRWPLFVRQTFPDIWTSASDIALDDSSRPRSPPDSYFVSNTICFLTQNNMSYKKK